MANEAQSEASQHAQRVCAAAMPFSPPALSDARACHVRAPARRLRDPRRRAMLPPSFAAAAHAEGDMAQAAR
jgi:hypothetical protein